MLLKNPAQFARLQERLAQYRLTYNEKNYQVGATAGIQASAVRPRRTLWGVPADLLDIAQFAQPPVRVHPRRLGHFQGPRARPAFRGRRHTDLVTGEAATRSPHHFP
jgi:hypothetical protein